MVGITLPIARSDANAAIRSEGITSPPTTLTAGVPLERRGHCLGTALEACTTSISLSFHANQTNSRIESGE